MILTGLTKSTDHPIKPAHGLVHMQTAFRHELDLSLPAGSREHALELKAVRYLRQKQKLQTHNHTRVAQGASMQLPLSWSHTLRNVIASDTSRIPHTTITAIYYNRNMGASKHQGRYCSLHVVGFLLQGRSPKRPPNGHMSACMPNPVFIRT